MPTKIKQIRMIYFYTLADLLRYNKKHKIIKQGNTQHLYRASKEVLRHQDEIGRACYLATDLPLMDKWRADKFPKTKHSLTVLAKLLKTSRQTLTQKRKNSPELDTLVLSKNNKRKMKEIKEFFAKTASTDKIKKYESVKHLRKKLFIGEIILMLGTSWQVMNKTRQISSTFAELVKIKENYLYIEEIKGIFKALNSI